MKINLSIINPISSKYHALHEFKENLSGRQKVAALTAAFFASIIPVIGTIWAFRKVVKHYDIPAEWQDDNFIKLPPSEQLNVDKTVLVKKLLKAGLTPDNFKYTRIWTAVFTRGNNAETFGAERAPYIDANDVALHQSIQPEENLCLHIPMFNQDLANFRRRIGTQRPHNIALTVQQAFGNERLPQEFIDFVKKTN